MTPLAKSTFITTAGYLAGVAGQSLIYPIFGLTASITSIFTIGIIFTAIAFVSNYVAIKAIELIELKE